MLGVISRYFSDTRNGIGARLYLRRFYQAADKKWPYVKVSFEWTSELGRAKLMSPTKIMRVLPLVEKWTAGQTQPYVTDRNGNVISRGRCLQTRRELQQERRRIRKMRKFYGASLRPLRDYFRAQRRLQKLNLKKHRRLRRRSRV